MPHSCRSQPTILLGGLVIIAAIGSAPAQVQAAPSITRSVTGNGGVGSTAGLRVIRSTLGQPVAGRVAAGNYAIGAGAWSVLPAPTDGLAESSPAPIEHYRLYSAVPNPFNPRTTIPFDVPARGGRVRLSIHDVRGRLVKVLVDGEALPGHQTITWDGRDDTGRSASSGIFILSLEAGDDRITQKLVLLR